MRHDASRDTRPLAVCSGLVSLEGFVVGQHARACAMLALPMALAVSGCAVENARATQCARRRRLTQNVRAAHCGSRSLLQPLQPTRNPLHRLLQTRQALRVGNADVLVGAVVAEVDAGRKRNMFGFQKMRAKRLRII